MDPATVRKQEAELLRRRIAAAPAADRQEGRPPLRPDREFLALLENVRSLWNVGSMFRTADGAGISRLLLTGITGCPPRPEISKTALGADEVIEWEYLADPVEAAHRLRESGFRILALETEEEQGVAIDEVDPRGRICLAVGHEVAGLSGRLLELADEITYLPMRGVKASLNVAVAFGIAAYQLAAARDEEPAPAAETEERSAGS
jgi:tRNA G18 (ribose-2'-O)-methylase SpoU